jgi:hypothetical protein
MTGSAAAPELPSFCGFAIFALATFSQLGVLF